MKPCPFCGGGARLAPSANRSVRLEVDHKPGCFLDASDTMRWYYADEESGQSAEEVAAEEWNRRSESACEPKVRCVAEVKVDGEQLEQLVHDAAVELTGIDRDALLALADEFDKTADYIASCIESMAGDIDMQAVEAESEQRDYARRIREALGVES